MPNRQYQKGDRFEKKVMNDLRRRRYVCWQTRGSKSAVDVIALSGSRHTSGVTLLVQAKGGDENGLDSQKIGHTKWNELLDAAYRVHGAPVIADRDGRKIRYRLITGYHVFRSRDWPAEDYSP